MSLAAPEDFVTRANAYSVVIGDFNRDAFLGFEYASLQHVL